MRTRSKVIACLEGVYREAFEKAGETGDQARMESLDFRFQRDQVLLEVMLDIRDSLSEHQPTDSEPESGLLDKAKAIRSFTKLSRPW